MWHATESTVANKAKQKQSKRRKKGAGYVARTTLTHEINRCIQYVAYILCGDLISYVDLWPVQSLESASQIGWFGLRVGGHPELSLHSSSEPGELSQWLCHDDSTINIVVIIIIIITLQRSQTGRYGNRYARHFCYFFTSVTGTKPTTTK